MTEPTQGERLARVEEAPRGLKDAFDQLAKDLRDDRINTVSRNEWVQHNTTTDLRLVDLKTSLDRKIADDKAKSAPWWILVGLLVSIATGATAVLVAIAGAR